MSDPEKTARSIAENFDRLFHEVTTNALIYGTGFLRIDSNLNISVVDPKDYKYLGETDDE